MEILLLLLVLFGFVLFSNWQYNARKRLREKQDEWEAKHEAEAIELAMRRKETVKKWFKLR